MLRLRSRKIAVGLFVLLQAIIFAFGALRPTAAQAGIPSTLGYQGRLKNAAGTAQTGNFSFVFRIYASTTGGVPIWTETQPSVSVDTGAFAVQLGSVTAFPAGLDFNQPLFLTLEVNSDGEMTPRISLNSVPYSYTSGGISALPAAPGSATGGRMYYDTAAGTLNYYDGVASNWKTLGTGATTDTLQSVTNSGNITTNAIQFAGGSSTGAFTFNNSLAVTGATNLQNLTAANATVTSLTITGTTPTSLSSLSWTNATGTNTTSTNLAVLTSARLPSDTRINSVAVCLLDGTNCPSSTASSLQTVTNAGNTTTNAIIVYGGITTSNLTSTGTTSLLGMSFSVSTGTSVTTTNLAVISGLSLPNNSVTDVMVVNGLTIDQTGNVSATSINSGVLGNAGVTLNLSGFGSVTGSLPATRISMPTAGSVGSMDVQHRIDLYQSNSVVEGGDITQTAPGTIQVTGGRGFVRADASSDDATSFYVNWATTTLGFSETNTWVGVFVSYNGGSPIVVTSTNTALDDDLRYIRVGEVLSSSFGDIAVHDERLYQTQPQQRLDKYLETNIKHLVSAGCVITATGTRGLAVSACDDWYKTNYRVIPAYSSLTFPMYVDYRNGSGGYVQATTSQWDNLRYDDGTGVLAPIGAGEYGIFWVYRHDYPESRISLLYGQVSYATVADAMSALPPETLPENYRNGEHAFLIGGVVFAQGGSAPHDIRDLRPRLNAGSFNVSGGGTTNHNDLSGLQGGTINQYYHLSATGFDAAGALHFSANGTNTFLLNNNSTATTEFTFNNAGGGVGNLNLVNGSLLMAGTTRINNSGIGFLTGLGLAGGGITNAGSLSGISNLTATGTTSLATLTFTNGTATSVTSTNLYSTNAAFANLSVSGVAPSYFANFTWTNATGTNTTSTNLFAINASTTNLEALYATVTHMAITHHLDVQTINFTTASGTDLTTFGTVSSTFIHAGDTILENTTAHTMVVDTILRVGVGNFPVIGNSVAQFGGATDTFLQVNIQNHSSGTSASQDFIATNDIGDDTSYYIDMGINGSNYNVPEFSIVGPNDGYLYTHGNNLAIGTASASTAILFHAGGTTAADEVMRITSDHYVGIGTTSPSSTFHVVGTSTMDGLLTVSTASSSILFFGSSTGTSLSILSSARLPANTQINNTAVCLLDGTNCPSGTSPNFQTVTNSGNTTTKDIAFAGGTSTRSFTIQGNLTVTGTSALQGLTFINASGQYIDYSTTTVNPSYSEGRLFYDNSQKALAYFTEQITEPIHVGQEVILRVRNLTGSPMLRGQAVRVVGDDGAGLPTIALARADSKETVSAAGLVAADIPNGAAGFVTNVGIVSGLDTSAFATGDVLYLSAATSGAVTNVRPATPNITLQLGIATKSDPVTGTIFVEFIQPKFGAITTGGVTFGDTNNFITERASVFFFDATNTRLGIGTNAPSSTLHVVGSTQLQTLTFTSGTGTSVTTTNLFTTNGTATNFVASNVTLTGGSIDGTTIGLTTPSLAVFSSVTSTFATTTNLSVLSYARLPANTQINNTAVCLLDGTNCPSSTSANFQTVTNSGNTTTNSIVYNGGTSTGAFVVGSNLTVTGTTALQGLTFNNATGLYVDFTTSTAAPAYLEGRLFYDNVEKSLAYYNNHSGITLNIGQETMIRVKNETGSTILNGQAVYASGADGGYSPTVSLSKADATSTAFVLGLATEDIPDGTMGFVTRFGLVHELDTSSLIPGAQLFLSDTVAGAVTTTRPLAPSITILVGEVTKQNAVDGAILVNPSAPRNGQIENGGLAFGTNDYMTDDSANLFWDNTNHRLGIGTNAPSSTLHVVGSTQLQTLTFTNGTGTSVTSTNLFTSNGAATNFVSSNVTLTGGSINGTSIGLTTPSLAIFSSVTSTNATTTNLAVLTSARLPSDTKINNTNVCLLDGTNCPSSTAANLQVVTNTGNTTTNAIIVYGGITTSNLTASGTVSLGGTTFTLATGTAATTTNFFSTYGTLTNGIITNGTIANLTFTGGTSTSWFGFATASGTTINALNSNFNNLIWTNATGTNTTSTNLGVTGLASIANLSVTGITSLSGLTWSSATGTNTTSTNLGVTNLALIANLTVTGTTGLQNFTFASGTGTSATTTNFFSTNGLFNLLTASSTNSAANTLSVQADSPTSGNGLVIDYVSNSITTGAAFLIRDNGVTNFAIGTATGLVYNATGTKSAIFTLATSTAYLQVATGNLIVGNSTATALLSLSGNDAYVQGTLEVDGQSRFDGSVTLGSVTANARTNWTNANISSGGIESIRSLQPYNGYLYAGRGDSAGDGDVMVCDPTLGGDTTLCDVSADWATSTNSATASVVSAMTVYQNRLYIAEGSGAGLGLIRFCNPALSGSATICESGDWATATSTGLNIVRAFVTFNGYLVAAADNNVADTGIFLTCNPALGGSTNDCDNTADWSRLNLSAVTNGTGYEQIPTLSVYLGRLYAMTGISSQDNDLFACNPATGGNPETCDVAADWTRTINSATANITDYRSASVYRGYLFMGTGGNAGVGGTLQQCNPAFVTDNQLCDGLTDIRTVLTSAGTITGIPAMTDFDGVLMIGREGTASGDGKILEYRVSYATTTENGVGFQATYAFANYNGVLYAGRGNAAGNGQVWYYKRARQTSNVLSFQAGSSTGDVWFSQESLNSLGEGQADDAKSGAFKFSHGIITEAGAYDLAEQYPVSETGLEAGDVVSLDQNIKGSVIRSRGAYDTHVLGVISTKPGFTLSSEQKEGTKAVALAGRVPVKFSTENGTIRVGDALTAASTTGYAMKATRQGVMIGRALQDFNMPDDAATSTVATGTVMMSVMNGYYLPGSEDVGISINDATGTSDGLQSAENTPEVQLPAGSQISQGLGVITLVVRDATFTGKVIVLGTTTLRGPVVFGTSNSGRIKVEPGQTEISVQFEGEYPMPPHVFASPEIEDLSNGLGYDHTIWDGGYYLTNVTTTGFEIRLPRGGYCPTVNINPCPIALWFNWFVVGFESATPTATLPVTGTASTTEEMAVSSTTPVIEPVVPEPANASTSTEPAPTPETISDVPSVEPVVTPPAETDQPVITPPAEAPVDAPAEVPSEAPPVQESPVTPTP